jgi:hypothetical protein
MFVCIERERGRCWIAYMAYGAELKWGKELWKWEFYFQMPFTEIIGCCTSGGSSSSTNIRNWWWNEWVNGWLFIKRLILFPHSTLHIERLKERRVEHCCLCKIGFWNVFHRFIVEEAYVLEHFSLPLSLSLSRWMALEWFSSESSILVCQLQDLPFKCSSLHPFEAIKGEGAVIDFLSSSYLNFSLSLSQCGVQQ